jgi:hypothetical protein
VRFAEQKAGALTKIARFQKPAQRFAARRGFVA